MSTTGLVDGQPPEHFLPDQFLEAPLEPPHVRGLRVAHATRTRRTIGVVVLFVTVAFGLLVSLAVGSKSIPLGTVIEAFTSYDSAVTDHLIVRDLRLPRTILAVLVGAALGVGRCVDAGCHTQPARRPGSARRERRAPPSPWCSPSGPSTSTEVLGLVWFAFVGAAITSVLVYALGSMGRGGANPVRLALAGAALSALLGAFTGAVTLLDQATLDQFRFWAVGSLAGRDADVTWQVMPFIVVGLVIAIGAGRQLNALALGEEAARSLGTKVNTTRLLSALAITLLCGAAVAAVRPDRLRRAGGAAHDARVVRARPALAGAGVGPRRRGPAARTATRRAGSSPVPARSRSAS